MTDDADDLAKRRALVLPVLAPYLSRGQTLVIFVFIVGAFLLLAYRTEVAVDRIDQSVFEACEQRAIITKTVPNCEGLR